MGLGAIAAAAKMGDVDPLAMATWQAGEPVPFSFLVDAFDVRSAHAESSFSSCKAILQPSVLMHTGPVVLDPSSRFG